MWITIDPVCANRTISYNFSMSYAKIATLEGGMVDLKQSKHNSHHTTGNPSHKAPNPWLPK